jgi:hypothetical protein
MSTSRQSTLLAALQRTKTAPAGSDAPPVVAAAAQPAAGRGRVGKPVQFWMHDEDRQILRELAAWLAGQGIRPTDSMVVRAALRMVQTGPGFLDAYRKAAALDGRLKPPSLRAAE